MKPRSMKSPSDPVNARGLYELVRVPALLTLAVTLWRLAGETLGGSERWFNPEPGGAGALVGITWLAPVFGGYFAFLLARGGFRPSRPGRAVSLSWLAFLAGASAAQFQPRVLAENFLLGLVYIWGVGLLGAAIAYRGWPTLSRALLTYGLAARIPVMVVMLFAIAQGWGTHYDAVPPGFPEMGWLPRFLWIGFFPQLLFWVSFTLVSGTAVGSLVGVLTPRRVAESR